MYTNFLRSEGIDVLDSNKEKLLLPVEKDARSYSNVVFDFHEKEQKREPAPGDVTIF